MKNIDLPVDGARLVWSREAKKSLLSTRLFDRVMAIQSLGQLFLYPSGGCI